MRKLFRKIKNAVKEPAKVSKAVKVAIDTSVMDKDALIKAHCDSLPEKPDYVTPIHDEDFIYQFVINHPGFATRLDALSYYYEDSKKSAAQLEDIVFNKLKLKKHQDTSILEFASGYGAVTRHLTSAVSPAKLVSSDIHQAANEFNTSTFGVSTIQSTSDPKDYPSDVKFDIVFALSFFSHMPKQTWAVWLKTLFSLVKEDGCLIFTTQGLMSRPFHGDPEIPDDGFWFASNSEQKDLDVDEYGQTIVTIDYVVNEVCNTLDMPFKMIRQGYWWEHQDLYVIHKVAK